LPRLAPLVPIAIPQPIHVGHATPEFPATFYGHRFMQGITADRARLEPRQRARLARPLGEFLRALHAIDDARGAELGVEPDTLRRDMHAVAERTEPQFLHLKKRALPAGLIESLEKARLLLSAPPHNANAADEDSVIHGDFYARHLLLDAGGSLCGVLDWGDVCRGDRAVDLGIAYTFLSPAARSEFWAAYGEVNDRTRRRARHIGLCRHAISLLAYALDVDDRDLVDEASYALVAAVA